MQSMRLVIQFVKSNDLMVHSSFDCVLNRNVIWSAILRSSVTFVGDTAEASSSRNVPKLKVDNEGWGDVLLYSSREQKSTWTCQHQSLWCCIEQHQEQRPQKELLSEKRNDVFTFMICLLFNMNYCYCQSTRASRSFGFLPDGWPILSHVIKMVIFICANNVHCGGQWRPH